MGITAKLSATRDNQSKGNCRGVFFSTPVVAVSFQLIHMTCITTLSLNVLPYFIWY